MVAINIKEALEIIIKEVKGKMPGAKLSVINIVVWKYLRELEVIDINIYLLATIMLREINT